jgi:hypothetical protein
MALSNPSDLFFLSPASHLIGFCKSCDIALAIETKVPLICILLLPSPTLPDVLTENGEIMEDDLPGPHQYPLTTSQN